MISIYIYCYYSFYSAEIVTSSNLVARFSIKVWQRTIPKSKSSFSLVFPFFSSTPRKSFSMKILRTRRQEAPMAEAWLNSVAIIGARVELRYPCLLLAGSLSSYSSLPARWLTSYSGTRPETFLPHGTDRF